MSEVVFLEELRLRFDRIMQTKERIDNKTNSVITTAGTIATLFMGFGIFLLQHVDPTNTLFLIPAIVTLLCEVILTTFVIKFAIGAHRLQQYTYPIERTQFLNQDETVNKEMVTALLTKNDNAQMSRLMIDSYLNCINDNDKTNGSKVGIFENAQNFLLISIGLIPVFTFLVILAKFIVV